MTSTARFEKVLWRAQPFPDNHVPPSFLSDLQTNSSISLPSFSELSLASLRISARFLSVVLFALLFVHLHLATLEAELLLLGTLSFGFISSLAKGGKEEGRKGRVGGLLSRIIMGLVLLAVSPVLRTLTESTTSDSIWALSVALFLLHLALADYTQSRNTKAGKGLSETLSFNAAISASVVLASRLSSNIDTFTLLTLAITLFAPSTRTPTHSHSRAAVVVTKFAALWIATMVAAWQLEDFWVVVWWTNAVVVFISLVCPGWIKWAQGWKMEIKGPWDPAEPILSSRP